MQRGRYFFIFFASSVSQWVKHPPPVSLWISKKWKGNTLEGDVTVQRIMIDDEYNTCFPSVGKRKSPKMWKVSVIAFSFLLSTGLSLGSIQELNCGAKIKMNECTQEERRRTHKKTNPDINLCHMSFSAHCAPVKGKSQVSSASLVTLSLVVS